MARGEKGLLTHALQHPTVTPLTGQDSFAEGTKREGAVPLGNLKRDYTSFSSADDTYPAADWTPWDCCQCAAQTRDAMLEQVADLFGRYALVVFRHPKKGNVTRSEILFIVANDGRSNLLEKSFLNALWDMHMRILDLKVTDEDDGDGLAAAAAAVAETGDTVQLPTRRLERIREHPVSLASYTSSGNHLSSQVEVRIDGGVGLFGRRLAWADPGAMVQQHLVQQQLRQQQPQWAQSPTPTPVLGRRRREAMAAAAQQQQQQQLATLGDSGEVCDPERQLPRNRITGLGCRPPLAPGEYGFANLCARDATGACEVPDGLIFVYGHKSASGMGSGAASAVIFAAIRLREAHKHNSQDLMPRVRRRYQLSDDAKLRPHALRWERKLLQLLEQESLPGARIGVKTERSLSDELAASSSAGPGGEIILVTAAGALIGVYVWVVNFSRSHLRSKAVVGLTGAGAALLGFLGGAGICFMAGVLHTGTAAAAPLLVVGIGVDDTLVLLQSYSLTVHKRSAADRLQLTLRDSGVGITITTLTNLITFGIGAFSPYLAIQSFCLICSAGLFLGYFMCLTFFLGFLALDAKAEAARHVICIFRCCPMGVMRDSAPVGKTTGEKGEGDGSTLKNRRGARTIKALPALQYLDKTKLPGAEASALSACASDIFQCITMQVEAALQQQQQQRLIEAEARRLRKGPASTKKRQKKTAKRKTKKKKAQSKSDGSDESSEDGSSDSSGSEAARKPKRTTKKPKAKARPKKAPKAKAGLPRASWRSSVDKKASACRSKDSKVSVSVIGSHRSSKKQQQRKRQQRAKALRPALKGKRQPADSVAATSKASAANNEGSAGVKPAGGALESQAAASACKADSRSGAISVRLAKRRGTNVRFCRKSSTTALSASNMLLKKQRQQPSLGEEDDWKDRMVVSLCVGSGSAVVAAAAEAAEAAFNTAGRSWSGERIARLQLLQRLGGGGLAEPQGNVGSGVRKVLRFFDMQEEYFGTYGEPVMIFFSHPENVCSAAFRVEYQKLHERLKQQPYTMELQDGLFLFLQSPLGRNVPEQSSTTCMQMLYAWLQTPFGSSFASFFSWSSGFRLRAWALVLVPKYFSSTQENSDFMHSLRADLALFPLLKGSTYNRNFVYFESDDAILPQTVSSMASAGCAVVIVSLFLLPSLRGALLVVGVLLLIDIVILGFMALWGLPLNLLTMVNLTISIGFSVDYATHTTHAFCHCMGQKRGLRAFEAVLLVGGPLLHGAISTQLAVIPLAFVESPVLEVFFKMTTLVIVVGVTHGLLLLPVLLSLVGPLQQSHQKMVQQLLVLQQQYEQLEDQIIAAGGSRANPKLKQQRRALRRLIEQQQQPPETSEA
ncbi:hypothetical protein Emag_001494 [Eimeria magna]